MSDSDWNSRQSGEDGSAADGESPRPRHSLAVELAALPALAEALGAPYAEVHCLARTVGDRVEADVDTREWVFTSPDGGTVRRRPFGWLELGGEAP